MSYANFASHELGSICADRDSRLDAYLHYLRRSRATEVNNGYCETRICQDGIMSRLLCGRLRLYHLNIQEVTPRICYFLLFCNTLLCHELVFSFIAMVTVHEVTTIKVSITLRLLRLRIKQVTLWSYRKKIRFWRFMWREFNDPSLFFSKKMSDFVFATSF